MKLGAKIILNPPNLAALCEINVHEGSEEYYCTVACSCRIPFRTMRTISGCTVTIQPVVRSSYGVINTPLAQKHEG